MGPLPEYNILMEIKPSIPMMPFYFLPFVIYGLGQGKQEFFISNSMERLKRPKY
jgi:hypothetical protein